jgi:selenium metabolism protein YedF
MSEEKRIDARGKACPQPVLLARKAIDEAPGTVIRVIVDNDGSAENVRRMAESLGCSVRIQQEKDGFHVVAGPGAKTAGGFAAGEPEVPTCDAAGVAPEIRPVVLLGSDQFGEGEPELGRVLMSGFLKTLKEVAPLPAKMIFANTGVRLTTEGSGLLRDLRELEDLGVEILSCGTCLDYFELKEKLGAGRVSNMHEIASALLGASSVIRP